MEITPARFGYCINDDGAFGVLRAEVRSQHLELLDHVRVGVDRRCAVAARVGDVGAIRRDVDRTCASSVGHIGAV